MQQGLAGVSILVADDDVDSAELLELLLVSQGAKVRLAADGAQTLAALAQHRPSVLLLDITLPDISGYELLAQVRSISGPEALPAVAITGHASASDRARALAASFSAHVVKPIDTGALVKLLAELVAPSAPPTALRG